MMKKHLAKITLGLCAAGLIAIPGLSRAQTAPEAPAVANSTTNAPAAPAKPKKHDSQSFRGTVSAIDTNAMTLTVESRTFEVTSTTKITKNGQPAILSDIAVGDKVSGSYKKAEDGKLAASKITDGKKPAAE